MKRGLIILVVLGCGILAKGQHIPVPLTQTRLYDFLDELLTEGVVTHQTSVRPYTRKQVASMLVEAQAADTSLNLRNRKI